MLTSLGYRIPGARIDGLLGAATAYMLNGEFTDAWNNLPGKATDGRPRIPSYAQLATALTAAHGQPVRLFQTWQLSETERRSGGEALIITRGVIDSFKLTTAFNTWERLIRGEDRSTLAPLIPDPEPTRRFADYIRTTASGTADAPGWVFDCAKWEIMRRLAQIPLMIDRHRRLAVRLDTDGSLLGWDDLIENTWDDIVGYAMLRITARIVTFPGLADLVILFDAHRSRINHQWAGTKNAWIERDDKKLPILFTPVRHTKGDDGRWTTVLRNHAATVAAACGMERLHLDSQLPERPGRVRPLVPGPRRHPIGRGPGPRLMLRLAEHIARAVPELVPLSWRRDNRVPEASQPVLNPATVAKTAKRVVVTPAAIRQAITSANRSAVRLYCLYATSAARQRMVDQLSVLGATPTIDDECREVIPGVAVSFHHVPKLLAHGTHDRNALLPPEITTSTREFLKLAWVETEYSAALGSAENDAKNPLRRLLAKHGVASQFLSTSPPGTEATQRSRKSTRDHPAEAGLRDLLLRIGGVLDPQLADEVLDGLSIEGDVTMIGIHARRQNAANRDRPQLVLIAVALHAPSAPTAQWRVEMYSDNQGWQPYAQALADFHAGPIGRPELGRYGDKASATRLYVESVLGTVGARRLIIFADTVATRTIWSGLQNSRLGSGALPAITLPNANEISIVRCNTGSEVPRPVNRSGGRQPTAPGTPAAPDRYVYKLADTETPVWLFPKSSRSYRAKGGRIGAHYTPWTLPTELNYLLAEDWHSYTGTEITVVQPGRWKASELAVLTARLCDHTVAWDDRTNLPIPLHLATRADQTHPDYRTDDEEEDCS